MQIRKLFDEERAVSPVIGVILMVAITVILAAVIGTFVLGLGDQVQQTAPQASFTFDYDSSATQLTVTHDGGDSITAGQLSITGDKLSNSGTWDSLPTSTYSDGDKIGAGDSISVGLSSAFDDGDTVRITWQGSNGDSSATLGKFVYGS